MAYCWSALSALHLVLPQIPGLERALRLVAGTSHLLVGVAFLAELLSELCYAELLRRSVGVISNSGILAKLPKAGKMVHAPPHRNRLRGSARTTWGRGRNRDLQCP